MENHLVAIAVGIMSVGFVTFYLLMKKYSTKEDLVKIKFLPIPMGVGWWGASDWISFKKNWKKYLLGYFIILICVVVWSIMRNR